jgi:hypothetical protein
MSQVKWLWIRFVMGAVLSLLSSCNLPLPLTPTPEITSTPQTPVTITLHPQLNPSIAHFQVFILSPVTTCIVGNEFYSGNVCRGEKCGDCNCAIEDFDPPSPITGIAPEHIDDPAYAGYKYRECFEITLTETEITDIKRDMEVTRDAAFDWSGGSLWLDLEFQVISHTYLGFVAPDFVFGPFEVDDELLNPYVSTETDFVYVVTGGQDHVRNVQLAGWCGSAYGELSIHGAGYSYIQYQPGCNSVTIDGESVYEPLIHEWVHNLDWALYNIDQIPDLYQFDGPDWTTWDHASWPACGTGDANPLAWFPSIDFCEWDPDWMDCNNIASAGICAHAGEVDGLPSWYEHVISVHYPRDIVFNGNFCTDGVQDWSETGVDSGWPCP